MKKNRPVLPESYIDEDLSLQGEKLRGFSFGSEGLISDWYWMRSLQYIGEKVLKHKSEKNIDLENLRPLNPRLLYPLLDNATTLDPKFLEVYSYGAIVLPAIDPEQAIKITRKGIKNNPGEWRLYQHLGFIYWKLKDYKKAAGAYERGSQIKNSPPFMKFMAARMQREGGSRQTAREIYQQMFDSAQNTRTKENARIRLLELDSLDEREAINKALDQFRKQTGRCVKNWSEIFPLLQKIKLPGTKDFRVDPQGKIVDPTDTPYLLDRKTCRVNLDSINTKLPPPIDQIL